MFEELLNEIKGFTQTSEAKETVPVWALTLLKGMEAVCNQLYTTNETLNTNYQELKKENESLKLLIDAQEQYSRRNCILIHGIPENDRENTDQIALDVIKNQLGIPEAIVNKKSIDRSHRIGKKRTPTNDRNRRTLGRPIIVKFGLYNERNEVFYKKKHLKNSNVMITENLRKMRYELLKKSIEMLGKKSCWTKDGRILTKINDGIIEIRGWSADGKIITLNKNEIVLLPDI